MTPYTPPFVAREFHRLIPNSELHFIDKCGHAPMMEQPEEFNVILDKFFKKLSQTCNSSLSQTVLFKNTVTMLTQ
jgi:hypothetical protein